MNPANKPPSDHRPQSRSNQAARRLPLLSAAVLLALGGHAIAQDFGIDHAREYKACMELARTVPEDAFESALAWADRGGDDAAAHCAAVALVGLGHYEQAAGRLEQLAGTLKTENAHLRVGILAQAAQAWLLTGQIERAFGAQTAALKIEPENVELLIDRSILLGAAANYWEAIDDLNRAAELAPERADVLIYRANAYRFLEALELAREDVERALALAPDDPEGLLERGNIHRLSGNVNAAREDWLRAAELAEGNPTGDAAQANLAKLDLKVD